MKYFAYGSLLDEAEMIKTCSDFKLIGKACLPGYRIDFTRYSRKWGAGVADIVKDDREDYPDFYIKSCVSILDENGNKMLAFTYDMKYKGSFVPPSEKYLHIMKKAEVKYDFPDKYKKRLKSIRTK